MAVDITGHALYPLSDLLDIEEFPLRDFIPADALENIFESLFYTDAEVYFDGENLVIDIQLAINQELALKPPGNAMALVFAPGVEGWTSLHMEIILGPDASVTFFDTSVSLRISENVLKNVKTNGPTEITISGDIYFSSSDVTFDNFLEEPISLPPTLIVPLDVVIESLAFLLDFSGNKKYIAIQWTESNLNRLLKKLIPNVSEQSAPIESEVILQIILNDPIEEIRLDWELTDISQTLNLPGLQIITPDHTRFSLLLGAGDKPLTHVALLLTLPKASTLTASSNFAWERDDNRELQNNEERESDAEPFFKLDVGLTDVPWPDEEVTIVLVSFDFTEPKIPQFFRQLEEPIPALDFTASDSIGSPFDLNPISLELGIWDLTLNLNIDSGFKFPFLNQDDSVLGQYINIEGPDLTDLQLNPETSTIPIPFKVTVKIGDLQLTTDVDVTFNWETFALGIDHDQGLDFVLPSDDETYPNGVFESDGEYLGLRWRFKGNLLTEGPNKGKYHLFTLATKDYNYQLQQAPGAVFEVDFTKASDEPITFAVTDFALTPKGINLTATVTDKPARLNGIDTRFRFHGSRFQIVENSIKNFTLSGSGPLPPALVGDAMADIALQFSQRNGNLTLVAGGAQLRRNKLLHCKGTRFQFSIDALGLKFVNDGKFHLYFTLTGSAQFVLAASDDREGALALLPNIKIELLECPLTGDASAISKHVKFLMDLPKKVSFNFLGCFEMELRGIGFVPQDDVFDGDGAMILTGQLKFAQGTGDVASAKVDFHGLHIGLPRKGSLVPRIHFKDLAVNLSFGAAFKLSGAVDFEDGLQEKGFFGEGMLQIQGLPTIAASFAFLRVRRDETSPWLRAWFIYLEVRQVSFMIPVVQFYLREVGLGFGYRYTLVSIKAADRTNDVKKLLQELKKLSRTQGDLSKRDRWEVDLEERGEDPRWTIVLRAMISQTSAAPSPLTWDPVAEKALSCVYLFDAIIAFRSDLTFFMAVRAWLNTNYWDYVTDNQNLRESPLFSGFVLLSPHQKRLLAHLASNPDGKIGPHPPLPDYIQKAIANSQFSVTLLVEPGLFHYEMGWPNMLRWKASLGPLEAEFRGGFIFRISKREIVIGNSFLARGRLDIQAEFDFGIVGLRLSAKAELAYGARYIGVVSFVDWQNLSAVYGAIGLEMRVEFAIAFWIRIKLIFTTITLKFKFSFTIGFTAGLEIGLNGLPLPSPGLRGSGTVSLSVMGHDLHLNVKLGINEDAVTAAFNKTQRFLNIGLEATEVEGIPGVDSRRTRAALLAKSRRLTRINLAPRGIKRGEKPQEVSHSRDLVSEQFDAPEYNIFIIRRPDADYFVIFPQGEGQDGDGNPIKESGFLPVPPNDDIDYNAEDFYDFKLIVPKKEEEEEFDLEQFDPIKNTWISHNNSTGISWKANWDANLPLEVKTVTVNNEGEPEEDPDPDPDPEFSLRKYLRHAFITEPKNDTSAEVIPIGDPDLFAGSEEVIEDQRVHNPTDNSFEAAVRGAVEQFRGSPFFKKDPNNDYENVLEQAFKDNTTIYSHSGKLPEERVVDNEELSTIQMNEQAQQLRGMVIHDLIADLREYAEASEQERLELTAQSIAFQMRLVFRVKGDSRPAWLDQIIPGQIPKISQRLGPTSTNPSEIEREVHTFNVAQTDFSKFPPQFQRVRQYTDANTIAITWDLTWERSPDEARTRCQADPEHHLIHYHVRRRALDANEREVVYTVKNAEVLHREKTDNEESLLKRLKSRFQVVDHFTLETLDDQADLPATGRGYLYTITPVDFASNAGRPLTLVATRFPNEPPQVPVNGELIVRYRLDEEFLLPEKATDPITPRVISPNRVSVTWSEPIPMKEGPTVPIAKYVLIFRKDSTLPIGSYGLDSATQGPRSKSLPTSNARPLPTDIKIELRPEGPREARFADISIETLQDARVFPSGATLEWRPDSWRIFFQTVSVNDVPSTLVPVQLLLRVEAEPEIEPDPDDLLDEREERRPAQLEWLPYPIKFSLLTPEDQRAIPGIAHFPMPELQTTGNTRHAPKFTDDLSKTVSYQEHPFGIRCIRFRWNQGPGHIPDYPLNLNAGYHILELDIDAHTTETFHDRDKLAEALRQIQEVQMLPADDLLLTPGDTLTTNQWEAWYPSILLRRKSMNERAEGSEISLGPWYSWRESTLEWPEWPGLTDGTGKRSKPLHPFLQKIIDVLNETYNIDLQLSPPIQPGDLSAFMSSTAPKVDPYGWGVLQRFGLSVAFSLHDAETGEILTSQELLNVIKSVLDTNKSEILKFLHVELLFQPGRSIRLETGNPDPDDLLAIVQLSFRPTIKQSLKYAKMAIAGPAGGSIDLKFHLNGNGVCSVINQAEPGSGQIELEPDATNPTAPIKRTIKLPFTGATSILVRSEDLPGIEVKLTPNIPDQNMDDFTFGTLEPFAPTSELSTYFTVPKTLAGIFSDASNDNGAKQWQAFKRYAESINSNDPDISPESKITIPTSKDGIESILSDFLAWSQRFFDAAGEVVFNKSTGLGDVIDGQWLATAYPRAGSPAYATPDETGRLQYDYLLEDKWAHTYRYYIRPFGRYDLLWQSFRQSRSLFPDMKETVKKLPEAIPDPEAGGLDVVLDRTQPVDIPLVLSSGRLDEASTPAKPAAPGTTWEVIVAQHPEQALIERNQTLYRQLAFRHIAFTLLRRFAFPTWIEQLERAIQEFGHDNYSIPLKFVENQYSEVPEVYPDIADHIDFDAEKISDEQVRSLDLPERIGTFQQGALVLQWEALPYFYEHRLLLIAQTASTVSPVNEVIQRDFEYRSPDPMASVEAVQTSWQLKPPFDGNRSIDIRIRKVHIPLRRFWDCLPPAAQEQWNFEAPDPIESTDSKRKLASIPDLEVVYQIVEIFSGNIEVQAEFFFDQPDTENYALRQLGRKFLAEIEALVPPGAATPQADFVLCTTLSQVTEQELTRTYNQDDILDPTRYKIAFKNKLLSVIGVFIPEDRDNILFNSVAELTHLPDYPDDKPEQIHNFLKTWYSTRAVSHVPDPDQLPDELAVKLDYPEPSHFVVAWTGSMTSDQKSALTDLADQSEDELQESLRRIANHETTFEFISSIPTGRDLPVALQDQLHFDAHCIAWRGPITSDQRQSLRQYHTDSRVFQDAVNRLLESIRTAEFSVPYDVPPRPRPDSDLPGTFEIKIHDDPPKSWILKWTGPMTETEKAELHNLTGDDDFKNGVNELIRQIMDKPFSVTIARDAKLPSVSSWPDTFEIKVTQSRKILKWTGPMTQQEETALRERLDELSDDDDFDVFEEGVIQLIGDVKNFYEGKVFETTISFAWPRVDKAELEGSIKHALPGLELPLPTASGPIRWRGADNLELPLDYFSARVRTCLREGNPFVQAFENLLNEIRNREFSAEFWNPRRPLQDELSEKLKDQLLLGRRLLRCRDPLTKAEQEQLLALFTSKPDKDSLRRLFADVQDQQALEWMCQDWFSQETISAIPQSFLPPELQNLVDFSEPTLCTLVWEGTMSEAETTALLALEGDDAFDNALRRLTKETEQTGEDDITVAAAPLGLDQVPPNVKENIQIDRSSNSYTKLSWTGLLFDDQEVTLTQWALPFQAFTDAVNMLLEELETVTITEIIPPARPLPEELPDILRNRLQIAADELAWIGAAPNDEEREALIGLNGDQDFSNAKDRLLQALDADGGESCVVAVDLVPKTRRTRQHDLPEWLSLQLTIDATQVRWQGSIRNAEELQMLQNLPGDEPFMTAIKTIIDKLKSAVFEIDFALPVRPQAEDLPEILRDKLLIGRALIRYHGLMTVDEGHTIQALFELQTDKNAVQRLYDASLNKGLRGRELRIRARRGSATPSSMNVFETKKL